jgi:tRNA G37 N-methylase Trm5
MSAPPSYTPPPSRPVADVPFVPTPHDIVMEMLKLAEVKPEDVVYDLGCGDGRIVVAAAKHFGAKAVGVDKNPQRVAESLENVKKNGVEDRVTIVQDDLFNVDLSPATVITMYLLPSVNNALRPTLEKLKPGTRIVSHDFDIDGVRPKKVLRVRSDESHREHTIYLWVIPFEKVGGGYQE